MKNVKTTAWRWTARWAAVLAATCAPAGAAPGAPGDAPFTVDYYYTARWGQADEFIRLFKKNHYPVLEKQVESGRLLSVTAVRPRYHGTEEGRWDYRVTLVFRSVAAAHDNAGEEAIVRALYPDQETFRREEQRRFEILEGHWDVPLVPVDLER
ncbi:MAG TPA: hypothetical protein VMT87_12945 [Vicinamibacteria bacterium]|nr:hypothetical protein [Vicinamibacteria bacterium]